VIAVLRARAAGGLCDRRDRPGRRDPACTFRPLRDRTVTTVTTVIAVIAVIAVIVSSGPVQAVPTMAKGAVSPVTAVSMASDEASQGGGAGTGRDRYWRGSLSGEGRSGLVAELRDREQSPELGRRSAAAGQRWPPLMADMGGSSEAHPVAFHWLISISLSARENPIQAPSGRGEPPEPIGQSRAASRPRPAKICQVQLGRPKVTRMSGRAEPRTPRMSSRAVLDISGNKAQEAEQPTSPAWGIEGP
jgi:hypothetical protein